MCPCRSLFLDMKRKAQKRIRSVRQEQGSLDMNMGGNQLYQFSGPQLVIRRMAGNLKRTHREREYRGPTKCLYDINPGGSGPKT